MVFNPHDYQKYAVDYIKTHPVAAVLLDMGLGKTSITLTAINDLLFDSFDVHKVLVIYNDSGEIIEIHERKLDALEDIIESMNGKLLLVAYWFKHDYERICSRLQKLHIPFSKLDTDISIKRWNNGEIPVALIHPASAGHGLNLQSGGSTIVWFGLTWSLELYQQTNARLWRQGQTSETVVIQHIATENTIDKQILKALQSKDKTQSALIDAVKASLGG